MDAAASGMVPWLFNLAEGEFIRSDDSSAIETKAAYEAGNELGGVMFWELSGDSGTLIDAVWTGFGNPLPADGGLSPYTLDRLVWQFILG